MKNILTVKQANRWMLYNAELLPDISVENFSCEDMAENDLVTGFADGRGQTCFYRSGEKIWALRHYLRGGLIAKLLRDHYFGFRLKNTRAWKEWYLLNSMTDLGLPVPVPVAASIIRKGLFYQADLVTEFIPSSNTLADVLTADSLDAAIWQKVGRCVRHFHDCSVFHSDLNARNILIDNEQKIYLIDFDNCRFRSGDGWKTDNLARLKRSFEKFKSNNITFNFEESCWVHLMSGYHHES